MRTAIVILNWNGQHMLEAYLPSVIKFSKNEADIIVADNASTDDSISWLNKHFPTIRTIVLDKNYGFAEGYNKALKQVNGYEYYILLNSDVEVTHHWLTSLIESMDAHKDIAACQPKILSMRHKESFEYAGASGGFIDKLGYPFCRGRIFGTVEDDNGQYDNPQEVLWATGACLMIRADDYWQASGLDGRFFAHNEEIDLCWRLHLMGRKIYCFPESQVYHLGGGTLPQGNPRKTYLNFRNNLTMLWKNLPDEEFKGVMRKRWFLDYVAAIQSVIAHRNLKDLKAIYKARRDFYAWKSEFDKDRETIKCHRQRLKISSDEDGRSGFSILWQYYIKGHKRFSDLQM